MSTPKLDELLSCIKTHTICIFGDSEGSLLTFSQSCNRDKKENPHSHHLQLHHHCVCMSILLVWKYICYLASFPPFILNLCTQLSWLDVWWWLQSLNQSDRTCGDVFITCFNSIGCHFGVGWYTTDIWSSHKIDMVILYKHTLCLSDMILASFPHLHA